MKVKEQSENGGLKCNIQKAKSMASGSITSQQIERKKVEAVVTDFLFWTLKSLEIVTVAIQLEENYFLAGKAYKHRQCFKKQRNHFADKGSRCQGYGPSNSHAWM